VNNLKNKWKKSLKNDHIYQVLRSEKSRFASLIKTRLFGPKRVDPE